MKSRSRNSRREHHLLGGLAGSLAKGFAGSLFNKGFSTLKQNSGPLMSAFKAFIQHKHPEAFSSSRQPTPGPATAAPMSTASAMRRGGNVSKRSRTSMQSFEGESFPRPIKHTEMTRIVEQELHKNLKKHIPTMRRDFERLVGSETHGTIEREPSLRRMRARASQIEDAIPHHGYTRTKAATGKWIQEAIHNPGALHKTLGVPSGKKIPLSLLEKAEHSRNPTTRRRAQLAETLRGFHKGR